MTKVFYQPRRDAAFLATEANGHLSREVVTLVPGIYPSGAVLAASDGEPGQHELLSEDHVLAEAPAVVLISAIEATDGPVEVAVIARHAEVKRGLIEAADGVAPADIAAALALNTIVVRDSF